MKAVEIITNQGSVVLRARNSELLILPHHTKSLKKLIAPKKFSDYFLREALVNRSARKLFEAWLRKDQTIWPRIYKTIHEVVKDEDFPQEDSDNENQTIADETAKTDSDEKLDKEKKASAKKKTGKVNDSAAKKTEEGKTKKKTTGASTSKSSKKKTEAPTKKKVAKKTTKKVTKKTTKKVTKKTTKKKA